MSDTGVQSKQQTFRQLFSTVGISFTVDGQSWQFVPPKLLIGILVAFITLPDLPLIERVLSGMFFASLLILVLALHILGHILSSKLVSPPMTEARITPALIETRYHSDPEYVAPRVHLIRSLGGPLINFLVGAISFILLNNNHNPALAFFAGANLTIGIIVLLPFPSVDGGVIWRELLKLIRRS